MEKEIVVGIYKITSPSGKINIGQSWDIDKRWKGYKSLHNSKYQIKLHNSFKKYGVGNHTFEKWETLPNNTTQEYLNEREIYWIKFYKDQGFEMLNIKEGGSNGKMSQESIEKRTKTLKERGYKYTLSDEMRKWKSESLKGRKLSEETKLKIRIKQEKWLSIPENRKILSDISKGRRTSDETKKKISNSNIGRKLSEEHKRKIGESHKGRISPNKGKKQSEESIRKRVASRKKSNLLVTPEKRKETGRKISEANKGRVHSQEFKDNLSKRNTGRVISEETRRKIGEANKIALLGRKVSPESIQKQVETRRKNETSIKNLIKRLVDGKIISKDRFGEWQININNS